MPNVPWGNASSSPSRESCQWEGRRFAGEGPPLAKDRPSREAREGEDGVQPRGVFLNLWRGIFGKIHCGGYCFGSMIAPRLRLSLIVLLATASGAAAQDIDPSDRWVTGRRIVLAVTGLPPTFGTLRRFVVDERPGAARRLTDRMLADPAVGEHFGRHWLDLVRYADTHGGNLDNRREIWPYRDWVIEAWNASDPLDDFLTQQLAGDLIAASRPKAIGPLIASGFNRLHASTNENGVRPAEARLQNVGDRTDAFGSVFLGMTLRCAACHDHPEEPISTEDYYSLSAFFDGLDGHPLDGDEAAPPPVVELPTDEQTAQITFLQRQIEAAERRLASLRERWSDGQARWRAHRPRTDLTAEQSHRWSVAIDRRAADEAEEWVRRFRPNFPLDVEATWSIGGRQARWQPGAAVEMLRPLLRPVPRGGSSAMLAAAYRYRATDPRIETLWVHGAPDARLFWNGEPVEPLAGGVDRNVRRGRVSVRAGVNELVCVSIGQPGATGSIAIAVGDHASVGSADGADPDVLTAYYLDQVCQDPEVVAMGDLIAGFRVALADVQATVATSLVWRDASWRPQTHVLVRGQFDQPGETVDRRTPQAMRPMRIEGATPTRLDLARWATESIGEVTAAVATKRIWTWVTGQSEIDDARLRRLSGRLVSGGWDAKRLIRDLLANPSTTLRSRRRLDAEVIRDFALASSGQLDRRRGGPGVFPPQPPGAWAAVAAIGSNTGRYVPDTGADTVRRSVYTFWKRSAGPAASIDLDGPDRNRCVEFREVTNTPVQALMLLGDAQRMSAAVVIARRSRQRSAAATDPRWLTDMFQTIVLRPPEDWDRRRMVDLAKNLLGQYAADPALAGQWLGRDDDDLAAASLVALTLFNLDEVLCR